MSSKTTNSTTMFIYIAMVIMGSQFNKLFFIL